MPQNVASGDRGKYYEPGDTSPQAQARALASVVKAENAASPGKVAVLFPERGIQLRTARRCCPILM